MHWNICLCVQILKSCLEPDGVFIFDQQGQTSIPCMTQTILQWSLTLCTTKCPDLRIFLRVQAINMRMPHCCSGWQKSNVCLSHYQEVLPLSFLCRWKTVMCIEAGWQPLTNTNPHDSADCGAVRGSGVCDGVICCLSLSLHTDGHKL